MPEGWKEEFGDRQELAEAVTEIALIIAEALHRLDPGAAENMNFASGLAYNRLLEQGRYDAAELMLGFGRALTDHERFPSPRSGDPA